MKIVNPNIHNLSKEKLQFMDELFMDRYISPGKISGTQTLVARNGEIVHCHSQGLRDIEQNLKMEDDSIFRIYSMTKPVTGVALMQLYEKGYFHLADPVSKFLPEFKNQSVYISGIYPAFDTRPVNREMTIRDLLTHTSGLSYSINFENHLDSAYRHVFDELLPDRERRSLDLKDVCETLATLPLQFSPGEGWLYSVSIDVCARIVEVISGEKIDDYFKENIFDPLGMKDTGFIVPKKDADRLTALYWRTPEKKLVLEDPSGNESNMLIDKVYKGGGSGLASTIEDYFKFSQMLLNGGELNGKRILSRKTVELMTMNHLPENKTLLDMNAGGGFSEVRYQGMGYGLSMAVTVDQAATQISGTAGSYNWGGMASTFFWIDPKENLLGIFMTQLRPSTTFPFRGQMQAMVYGAFED
jgi:CubicO group peptidase (beta-lactamase class C family)